MKKQVEYKVNFKIMSITEELYKKSQYKNCTIIFQLDFLRIKISAVV